MYTKDDMTKMRYCLARKDENSKCDLSSWCKSDYKRTIRR